MVELDSGSGLGLIVNLRNSVHCLGIEAWSGVSGHVIVSKCSWSCYSVVGPRNPARGQIDEVLTLRSGDNRKISSNCIIRTRIRGSTDEGLGDSG